MAVMAVKEILRHDLWRSTGGVRGGSAALTLSRYRVTLAGGDLYWRHHQPEGRPMRVPIVQGVIERRILINFRVDPAVLSRLLPAPFAPKLIYGEGIAGICLIRLAKIRPRLVPKPLGIRSENAAHRIAVTWDIDGVARSGVFIPRRDTDSRLNAAVGGRLFPGVHHLAQFSVQEEDDRLAVRVVSRDQSMRAVVAGRLTEALPATSIFRTIEEASAFFEAGSLGYSATSDPMKYDGLELQCRNWHVTPMDVDQVESSYFDDLARFPKGSIRFDSALVMRGIQHHWRGMPDLCCNAGDPSTRSSSPPDAARMSS